MTKLTIEEIIEHCKRKTVRYEQLNGVKELENTDISNNFIKEYWEHRQVAECLEELKQYRAIGTAEQLKGMKHNYVEALSDWRQYRKIGTVEQCREARERQRAKKYKIVEPCKSVTYYQCPCCNGLLHINENFCGECGQAILWEEE